MWNPMNCEEDDNLKPARSVAFSETPAWHWSPEFHVSSATLDESKSHLLTGSEDAGLLPIVPDSE